MCFIPMHLGPHNYIVTQADIRHALHLSPSPWSIGATKPFSFAQRASGSDSLHFSNCADKFKPHDQNDFGMTPINLRHDAMVWPCRYAIPVQHCAGTES